MSHEPSKGWIDRRVRAAMRGEIDSLHGKTDSARSDLDALRTTVAEIRAQTADLRAVVQAMGVEIDNRATHAEANLTALREAIDRDERIEALRLRVEGLIAQNRWDTDQLRRAIAALAEQSLAND